MTNTLSSTKTSPSAVANTLSSTTFLSFRLGEEEYGVEVLRVREILALVEITPLPRAPGHIKGVINLHGTILPVIDLRTRLGMETEDYTGQTCIIVVEVSREPGDHVLMGLIVDQVRDVVTIPDAGIEALPTLESSQAPDLIAGIGRLTTGTITLLDIDAIAGLTEARQQGQATKVREPNIAA
jgi:purine-binding chemotaxis protein CheW